MLFERVLCIGLLVELFSVVVYGHETNAVLLISIDGVQAGKFEEYLKENPSSSFNLVKREGVKADYMVPSFPTSTWPNHHTIVTGLYPESHGIVGNSMYDPKYDEKVNFLGGRNSLDLKWWNETEPIWLTAKREGLRTGVSYWVGSDVITRTPDVWMKYDNDVWINFTDDYDTEERVHDVLNWINKLQLDFTALYFSQVDSAAHSYGVDSVNYIDSLMLVDLWLGRIIQDLQRVNLYNHLNLIITSDHGQAQMKPDCAINVFRYLNDSLIYTNKSIFGIYSQVYPKPGNDVVVYNQLKAILKADVYYKNEMPEHYHFSKHYRIAPIVVVSHEGYSLVTSNNQKCLKSEHGYSETVESMRTIFLAHGPAFKPNQQIKPFKNVDIYPLLCSLLNLKTCHSHNGTVNTFNGVIRSNSNNIFPKAAILSITAILTLIILTKN